MNLFRYILFTTLILTLATPAQAKEKYLILTEDFAPFNYPEKEGVGGISTSIVQQAFARCGLDYDIKILPWKRAVRETEDNPNVFLYTMARNNEREDKFIWVGKLFDRKVSLFRLRERNDLQGIPLETLLDGYSVCTSDGDAAQTLLRNLGFTERSLLSIPSVRYRNCAKIVAEGRADFMAFNPFSLKHYVEIHELPDVYAEQLVLTNEGGYYLAANLQSDPVVVQKLRQAFQELDNEGVNEQIAADYLHEF